VYTRTLSLFIIFPFLKEHTKSGIVKTVNLRELKIANLRTVEITDSRIVRITDSRP